MMRGVLGGSDAVVVQCFFFFKPTVMPVQSISFEQLGT